MKTDLKNRRHGEWDMLSGQYLTMDLSCSVLEDQVTLETGKVAGQNELL